MQKPFSRICTSYRPFGPISSEQISQSCEISDGPKFYRSIDKCKGLVRIDRPWFPDLDLD
jgi:hypothetical protein